jgi:hypothetical protein
MPCRNSKSRLTKRRKVALMNRQTNLTVYRKALANGKDEVIERKIALCESEIEILKKLTFGL